VSGFLRGLHFTGSDENPPNNLVNIGFCGDYLAGNTTGPVPNTQVIQHKIKPVVILWPCHHGAEDVVLLGKPDLRFFRLRVESAKEGFESRATVKRAITVVVEHDRDREISLLDGTVPHSYFAFLSDVGAFGGAFLPFFSSFFGGVKGFPIIVASPVLCIGILRSFT
jgi:hypothetical protein